MIEELTEDKLREYGFSEDSIERVLKWDNYPDATLMCNVGVFLASQSEQKIYSGKDAARKIYFDNGYNILFPISDLDLIREYYSLKQNAYLIGQKIIAGSSFIERAEKENFKALEIEICKIELETLKAKPLRQKSLDGTKGLIHKYGIYLTWLNNTVDEPIENEIIHDKPAVATYALMHVFLGKYDENKRITKTNCKSWADKYGFKSKSRILTDYNQFLDKKGRAPNEYNDNKNYLNPFFKRFEDAVNMLSCLDERGFNDANNELKYLKQQYEIK